MTAMTMPAFLRADWLGIIPDRCNTEALRVTDLENVFSLGIA